ncbi:unnamed protein product [Phytophthora fragariaefolia]|uniref:Unnamed protein product n=1 Tax=Phytophthora fragariaefolia TaxID=1490495 RepID=A0A9W6YQ21_9STRA|nr:unnamed protein product [Phytophthora fragariaefolia]
MQGGAWDDTGEPGRVNDFSAKQCADSPGKDSFVDDVVNAVDVGDETKVDKLLESSDGDENMEGKQSSTEATQGKVAKTTERFADMLMEVEDKVRTVYPYLLDDDSHLTKDSWMLNSGCGRGLTSEVKHFISMKPNRQYMFTFAQGSKLSNTHIGTINLYLHGPHGIRLFLFKNVAIVPNVTSNILSELWLRRSGYQILGSLRGEFKFVWYKLNLCLLLKQLMAQTMCKVKRYKR